MVAVYSRIILRYLAGALVTAGFLDANMGAQIGADPDVLIIVGTIVGAIVEAGYAFAKKKGWTT